MLKSKASMQSQSQLHKVSTRLGLVLLESHECVSGSFFFRKLKSRLGIINQKSRLGIIYITNIYYLLRYIMIQ